MNKSEQLIACLEGEIAKRDEELAARRVAVENCEVFRARIAELEDDLKCAHSMLSEVSKAGMALRAELAAIKAQEPVAWAGAIEYGVPLLMVEPQNWKATPLYAAPVSEAKAQGVVQWPDADEIMQMAFEEGQPADDASGYCFELEEFDLFIDRLMSEVARLNAAPVQQPKCKTCDDNGRIGGPSFYAPDEGGEPCPDCSAPVQQVSAPDGWRLVTTDWLKRIHRDLDACQKLIWANLRGCDPSYYEDAQERLREIDAMLAAAPAAPAADAGIVDMYRHLQKVTPYRFKKIQDASVTDGGDVLYFHKDRFDAALLADMAAHCAAKGVV